MTSSTETESPSDAVVRLSTALFVIYLMVIYEVAWRLSEADAVILCESLLLRTPTEDGVYLDIELVAKNFSTCSL